MNIVPQPTALVDLPAEQATLGSALLDPGALPVIRLHVEPGDFSSERHQAIAAGINALADRHEPIDIVTLRNELERQRTLSRAGGVEYIAELATLTPAATSAEHYAKAVAEASWRRRMREGLTLALAEVTDSASSKAEIEATIDRARGSQSTASRSTLRRMDELMQAALIRLGAPREAGQVAGLTTGFTPLDRMLGGLRPGQLIILAARPSLGKSTGAVQIARHNAGAGRRVIFFSAEMPSEEVCDRLIALEANIDGTTLGDRGCDVEVSRATGELGGLPMWVDDQAGVTVAEIRARCRYLMAQGGLDLVLVDYAQLLSPASRRVPRVEQVTQISGDLKSLAKELRVPLVLLSQLSRSSEHEGRRPRLSDLRESGSLEQDADVVMFLHHDRQTPPRFDGRQDVELIVAKHRGGPKGTIRLVFDGPRFRFSAA